LHLVLLSCAAAMAPHAHADIVRVRESTFNAFVDRLQPIPITGRYSFEVVIDAGPLGRHRVTVCNSAYGGFVQNLRFSIRPNAVQVTGTAVVGWCGLTFNAAINATGNAYYNTSDDTVRLALSSARVRPSFNIAGYNVVLPVVIDVAQTLNVPPLPIGPALIGFQTTRGARYLRMEPQNVTLVKRTGFVELEADVQFR
jgi:hypothetical protein